MGISVKCPHCGNQVSGISTSRPVQCPTCRGTLTVHDPSAGVEDEDLKRLLSSVKIVERGSSRPPVKPPKRPWWRFWG